MHEKMSSTQGKYGAVNENRPRNDICTYRFRRPHTYTIMNVRDAPRNWMLMNGATHDSSALPKRSM